jgi:hypothetical protein
MYIHARAAVNASTYHHPKLYHLTMSVNYDRHVDECRAMLRAFVDSPPVRLESCDADFNDSLKDLAHAMDEVLVTWRFREMDVVSEFNTVLKTLLDELDKGNNRTIFTDESKHRARCTLLRQHIVARMTQYRDMVVAHKEWFLNDDPNKGGISVVGIGMSDKRQAKHMVWKLGMICDGNTYKGEDIFDLAAKLIEPRFVKWVDPKEVERMKDRITERVRMQEDRIQEEKQRLSAWEENVRRVVDTLGLRIDSMSQRGV